MEIFNVNSRDVIGLPRFMIAEVTRPRLQSNKTADIRCQYTRFGPAAV